jgi:hypothetical protein
MGSHLATLAAVAVALGLAGCMTLAANKGGSRAPLAEKSASIAVSTFEVTELATGVRCAGQFDPLQSSAMISVPVACDDGRTGMVTVARTRDLSGTGTIAFADGSKGSVAFGEVATTVLDAPLVGSPPVRREEAELSPVDLAGDLGN